MTVLYDAGVLVAADRNDRRVWADHRARLEAGVVLITTAPAVAQVPQSERQVPLRRFLRGCDVLPFRTDQADEVGRLLAAVGTSDVIDAHLVVTAASIGAAILTSDASDLTRLSDHRSPPVPVLRL